MSAAIIVALSLFPSTARAHGGEGGEEEEFPVSFVERPLTLPRFVLAPFGELDITHVTGSVLAGMQIGASFAHDFNTAFPAAAEAGHVPLYPFLLDGVAGNAALLQGDHIHPNPAGVKIIAARLAPFVAKCLK